MFVYRPDQLIILEKTKDGYVGKVDETDTGTDTRFVVMTRSSLVLDLNFGSSVLEFFECSTSPCGLYIYTLLNVVCGLLDS